MFRSILKRQLSWGARCIISHLGKQSCTSAKTAPLVPLIFNKRVIVMAKVKASVAVDLGKVKKGLQEISDSLTRAEAERDYVKDAIKAIADENGLQKKIVAKMAKVYHKQNYSEVVTEAEEFQRMYEKVTGSIK